jgi:hypothetical protein
MTTDQRQASGTLLERPVLRTLPSLRERTRAANRNRYSRTPTRHSTLEFLCECARPDCSVRLPLEVERHRRRTNRFIVGLTHAHGDTIVGVADRFLVVEAKGRIEPHPRPSPMQAA